MSQDLVSKYLKIKTREEIIAQLKNGDVMAPGTIPIVTTFPLNPDDVNVLLNYIKSLESDLSYSLARRRGR